MKASKPLEVMQFQARQELEKKIVLLDTCRQACDPKDKATLTILDNQMKLCQGMIEDINSISANNRTVNDKFKEMTIEEFCAAPFIETGDESSKSVFMKRVKTFKLSTKKVAIIKIRGWAMRNEIPKLTAFIAKMNKRSEEIPYEIIFEYLENIERKDVKKILLYFLGRV